MEIHNIHVHSTLAKEYKGRKVIPTKGTHTCTSHTRIENCIGLRDTRMPSLENWGGESFTVHVCVFVCTCRPRRRVILHPRQSLTTPT